MYKNEGVSSLRLGDIIVSILVLMDLCIKTMEAFSSLSLFSPVSILVLMDLCIKTTAMAKLKEGKNEFQSLF